MYNLVPISACAIVTVFIIQTVILVKQKRKIDIYESAIKNLPVGLYFKDLSGKIIISNPQMSKILGFNKKESNNSKYLKTLLPQNIIDEMNNAEKEIIKTEKPVFFDKVHIPLNNISHYYRMIKSPIFCGKNKIKGFVNVFKNIDNEILSEKQKESFIATLTHDLKTPTNAQTKILNLMLNGSFGKLTEQQHEMLHLTQLSCRYMSDLISTIVDTYRYDCGNIKLKEENVDIINMIKKICKSIATLAHEKGQHIEFKRGIEKYFVYCDELQMKRVILNLLSNAVNYGFEKTSIVINFELNDGVADLSVTNKSFHIPEEQLENIFDKFSKTTLSGFNKASTSLGLYLSKNIIDMHNGKIYAKSTEDGLCTFGFTLPAACPATSIK